MLYRRCTRAANPIRAHDAAERKSPQTWGGPERDMSRPSAEPVSSCFWTAIPAPALTWKGFKLYFEFVEGRGLLSSAQFHLLGRAYRTAIPSPSTVPSGSHLTCTPTTAPAPIPTPVCLNRSLKSTKSLPRAEMIRRCSTEVMGRLVWEVTMHEDDWRGVRCNIERFDELEEMDEEGIEAMECRRRRDGTESPEGGNRGEGRGAMTGVVGPTNQALVSMKKVGAMPRHLTCQRRQHRLGSALVCLCAMQLS